MPVRAWSRARSHARTNRATYRTYLRRTDASAAWPGSAVTEWLVSGPFQNQMTVSPVATVSFRGLSHAALARYSQAGPMSYRVVRSLSC